jgi:hypothetical protein
MTEEKMYPTTCRFCQKRIGILRSDAIEELYKGKRYLVASCPVCFKSVAYELQEGE